jgi:hypothetical protein
MNPRDKISEKQARIAKILAERKIPAIITLNDLPDTRTENSAPAFSTVHPCIDLFSGLVRGTSRKTIVNLMIASYNEDPEWTLKILLHARDRSAKGERRVVYVALMWLRQAYPDTYCANLEQFLDVGCYKDLLQLAEYAYYEKQSSVLSCTRGPELNLFAERLSKDLKTYNDWKKKQSSSLPPPKKVAGPEVQPEEKVPVTKRQKPNAKKRRSLRRQGKTPALAKKEHALSEVDSSTELPTISSARNSQETKVSCELSLAAKWAPTSGSRFDKKPLYFAKYLCSLVFGKRCMKEYRTTLLTPLRRELKLVETKMCANKWDEINFSAVPARAHKILHKAFEKHVADKYKAFLEKVKKGEAKIKATNLQPHELAKLYIVDRSMNEDATIEAQWKQLITDISAKDLNALGMCDFSGSMNGTPMEVSLGLGLALAATAKGPFAHHILTFSTTARLVDVGAGSLKDQVGRALQHQYVESTNILAAFELLLTTAQQSGLRPEDMPKTIFIFTDMQFDQGVTTGDEYSTSHDIVERKFASAGYRLPDIVYWNLRGDTTMTVTDSHGREQSSAAFPIGDPSKPGVSLVSGYSPQLLSLFLGDGAMTPLATMLMAIIDYEVKIPEKDNPKSKSFVPTTYVLPDDAKNLDAPTYEPRKEYEPTPSRGRGRGRSHANIWQSGGGRRGRGCRGRGRGRI